jgi:sulfur carrier protein
MPSQGSRATIKIQLNGEPYSLKGDDRLTTLIDGLKLKPGRVAVELNREIVPKAKWGEVRLRDGDQLEVINFVGGG